MSGDTETMRPRIPSKLDGEDPSDSGLHDHRRDDDAEDPKSHEAAKHPHGNRRFAYSHAT